MATVTQRIATFEDGACTVDIQFDDLLGIVSRLIVTNNGTKRIRVVARDPVTSLTATVTGEIGQVTSSLAVNGIILYRTSDAETDPTDYQIACTYPFEGTVAALPEVVRGRRV